MIEEDTWGTHQDQEEQIVALTTEIKLLKSKAASQNKNNQKKGTKEKEAKGEGTSQQGQGDAETKKSKSKRAAYAEWMLKAPQGDQKKSKNVNGKQYWWCPHHQDGKGQWVRHKPEDHKDTKEKSHVASKNKIPKADVDAAIAEFLEREE